MRLTKAQRSALREMFGGRCAYCGHPLPEKGWNADHVDPVQRIPRLNRDTGKWVYAGEMARPELDTIDNMMPACAPCNNYKHGFTLEQFRSNLEHLPDLMARDHAAWRNASRFGMVAVVRPKIVFHFERVASEKLLEVAA